MRGTESRRQRWLAGSIAVAAIVIAGWIVGERKQQTTAIVPLSPPPSTAAHIPLSALPAERHPVPEVPDKPAEDFLSAIKLAVQNGEKRNDDRDVFELGYRWVAVEPEAALDFVLHLPADNTLLLVALVDEWTRRDPAAASAWAAALPEGPRRERVLPSLVAAWAANAPVDALHFASGLPPGRAKDEAVLAAVSGLARQDPPAALAWASQLEPGKQREDTFTQVVYAWGQRDPVSAAEWLRAMPDGPAWDAAVGTLSGVLVERYPALALSLAANISDQELRNRRIENIAHRWLDQDRAAAETALIQSDLPAALVSRLLR